MAVAWRPLADNQWSLLLRNSLAVGRDLPPPPTGVPGPYGLADPDQTAEWLHAAGFEAVGISPVDTPFRAGADADDAFSFVRTSGIVRGLTQGLDDAQREQALATLRAALDEHATPEGVEIGSGSWLITARRPT